MTPTWVEKFPLFWINLNRQRQRRERMEWAIRSGGWHASRWSAVDGTDQREHFLAAPRPWQKGSSLPGLSRCNEAEPQKPTSRNELACLSSWQELVEYLLDQITPSGWFLLMEDDVGGSLACPEAWPHGLDELTTQICPKACAIQLAPINANLRSDLHDLWASSQGQTLSVPKKNVRSHGNGAVLVHQRALPQLKRRLGRWIHKHFRHHHLLSHTHNIRPVADKWLYGSLPAETSWVATYPLFCLEAQDSGLHADHVQAFHQPSRAVTLQIWEQDQQTKLLAADKHWREHSP